MIFHELSNIWIPSSFMFLLMPTFPMFPTKVNKTLRIPSLGATQRPRWSHKCHQFCLPFGKVQEWNVKLRTENNENWWHLEAIWISNPGYLEVINAWWLLRSQYILWQDWIAKFCTIMCRFFQSILVIIWPNITWHCIWHRVDKGRMQITFWNHKHTVCFTLSHKNVWHF